MERLTQRYTDGEAFTDEYIEDVSQMDKETGKWIGIYQGKVIDKLAEYEDLEEQALLLRLPCKVGDTVYQIWNVDDKPEINEIKIATLNNIVALMEYGDFGKTAFLTQAEADQRLAEMEGK